MPDISTRTVRCAGGLPAFLAVPATDAKAPAVVLMHERYGLVRHTRDLAERFARDGFVCIAPDFSTSIRIRRRFTAARSATT